MEEIRWHNSAEEYRAIQELGRQRRYAEALERARLVIGAGQMGRKQTARFHSLVCRLYTDDLQQGSLAAITHGEEAVRLARLVNDPWVKCEALATLVRAYCYLGEADPAGAACAEIALDVQQNPAAIPGGRIAVCLLEADVAGLEGDWAAALGALDQALAAAGEERPEQAARIRVRRAACLLAAGRKAESALALGEVGMPAMPADGLQLDLVRAWLARAEARSEEAGRRAEAALELAQHLGCVAGATQALSLQALLAEACDLPRARFLARNALQRAIAAGRVDLAKEIRQRLAHMV